MSDSIQVSSKTLESASFLTVQVGTNCPQGGDAGHGGRTVFRLRGDNLEIRVDGEYLGELREVEILLSGDAECAVLIRALKHAVKILQLQTSEGSKLRGFTAPGVCEKDGGFTSEDIE